MKDNLTSQLLMVYDAKQAFPYALIWVQALQIHFLLQEKNNV